MKDWELARRDLLRRLGVGAACLPLLQARRRAWAAPSAPRRLVCVAQTMGYRQSAWLPPVGALSAPLPSSSSPLEPYARDLIFTPGLTDQSVAAGTNGVEGYGTLFYGLSDVKGTSTYKEPGGPTVDQMVANSLDPMGGARFSLALGVQIYLPPHSSMAAGATSCFWRGAGQPIVPELDPARTYSQIFTSPLGAATDDTAAKRLLLERSSILDYVGISLDSFAKRLGTEDRQVINGHFQAIRDLELQLASVDANAGCGGTSPPGAIDISVAANYPNVLALQMSLLVTALRCGVTQVATLQLSDAAGMNVVPGAFVPGIPASPAGGFTWYNLGHNPVYGGVDLKRIVDQWFMARFAELLAKLKAVTEPGGTMLDNTVVLWASNMEDGATRNSQALPWVLAGKCGGYFRTGQCAATAGKPSAGVLTEICHAMGINQDVFGAPIPGLQA